MSRNPWASKPHRFAVEELLEHPVVSSPNSPAPAPAGSVPSELGQKEAERKAEELGNAYDVSRT
jgi:hypothetical protein